MTTVGKVLVFVIFAFTVACMGLALVVFNETESLFVTPIVTMLVEPEIVRFNGAVLRGSLRIRPSR